MQSTSIFWAAPVFQHRGGLFLLSFMVLRLLFKPRLQRCRRDNNPPGRNPNGREIIPAGKLVDCRHTNAQKLRGLL